jgi:hypothetical protein
VTFPPPGHSAKDRSACLRFDQQAPGGFVIHSFAGDDPLPIRISFARGSGSRWMPGGIRRRRFRRRGNLGMIPLGPRKHLLSGATVSNPRGTPAEAYLQHRGLELPTDAAGEAIRFHPACPFAGQRVPAMICLVPRRTHQRALRRSTARSSSPDGRKAIGERDMNRLSLGPIRGGAIKLTPDEDVTTCLGIGEGLETSLSLRLTPEFGSSPVWCVLSAGGVSSFPVLSGIECLWIAVDNDQAGLRAQPRVLIAGVRPAVRSFSSSRRQQAPT